MRKRYPAALAIGVQENSTSLVDSPAMKIGAMLAGEMGVGGPVPLAFSMRGSAALKLTFSQFANCTVCPFRETSPVPFLIKISCWSSLGSLCTCAVDCGESDAVAPATMTC